MIVFGGPSLVPQFKKLWKSAFGDTDRYIRLFFQYQYRPQDTLADVEDEQVRSMLFFPRYRFRVDAKETSAGYICGAATYPEHRSKGLMSALIARAHCEMQRRGDEYSVLIPASKSLYAYYERFGYRPFFYRGKSERTASELSGADGGSVALCPADEKTLWHICGALSARWPCAVLQDRRRISMLMRFYPARQKDGDRTFLICKDGEPRGWMFCSYENGDGGARWLVREIEADGVAADTAAAALLRIGGASRVCMEGPENGGVSLDETRPAGMLRPLGRKGMPGCAAGYMNMMLD